MRSKHKIGSTILKEWTTPDSRNTPSTTNLEEEEIVDALGNDGNASMPEQVRQPNPWRKMVMMMMMMMMMMTFKPSLVTGRTRRNTERLSWAEWLETDLTFRHRASCILGQAFHYSPENAFYIFNQQIYFII